MHKPKNPKFVADLKSLLTSECALLERYQVVLLAEREHLREMKKPEQTDRFMLLTAQRDILSQQIQQCHALRMEAIKQFKEPRGTRFSAVLKRNLHPEEMQQLEGLVLKLRSLVEQTQKTSSDFRQVVDFALGLVGGLATMITSATHNVVRSYGRSGKVKESYHPTQGKERVLKQA